MNGTRYLFDTNTLINFFRGNPGLQPFSERPIFLSLISVIEFLSFPKITDEHKDLLHEFLKKAEVIDLNLNNTDLIDHIINVRTTYGLKLPDAIIAATALYTGTVLITNDSDFKRVSTLQTMNY